MTPTSSASSSLDAEELFQLALRASAQQQHEESITYLKRALEQDPKSARIHYMLGAEHAEIGLYDRAVEEIAKAVKLDPKLHTASFQLGLLQVTAGQVPRAIEAWAPLDQLAPDHFLYLFKEGLIRLVQDDFVACRELLEKGMTKNTSNPALNRDMQRILDDLNQRALGTKTNGAGTQKPKPGGKNNVLLSAYQGGKEDKT